MEEDRTLVQDVERVMIAEQIHAYTLCRRADLPAEACRTANAPWGGRSPTHRRIYLFLLDAFKDLFTMYWDILRRINTDADLAAFDA
jgi:hypothetical protein